ncbi:uncharacterized protein MONOS_11121 [Monocercomonoides exilis]|uniref:uncharacterized protein n=1 Tax=Monocercomonoides exilis TaxID=2049356 RepID=UPI00355945FB|nr:hypothetical protein MONOS_11121 [Monocercomonoides exilis]|eukprot:MONOS_11121.1-p1 / transcript=MONOS_11121.1 / gene=MONOS_11121 / organism=Monocercomonoides_exilis_PA203 / gene_product=unspecified product / transcript_product=unspecified product / location=Mono_scaffold00540:29477-37039(+) / protein_length=2145 / sequence_SO=supercontig / SO=protein_coding / is_pseudo=false
MHTGGPTLNNFIDWIESLIVIPQNVGTIPVQKITEIETGILNEQLSYIVRSIFEDNKPFEPWLNVAANQAPGSDRLIAMLSPYSRFFQLLLKYNQSPLLRFPFDLSNQKRNACVEALIAPLAPQSFQQYLSNQQCPADLTKPENCAKLQRMLQTIPGSTNVLMLPPLDFYIASFMRYVSRMSETGQSRASGRRRPLTKKTILMDLRNPQPFVRISPKSDMMLGKSPAYILFVEYHVFFMQRSNHQLSEGQRLVLGELMTNEVAKFPPLPVQNLSLSTSGTLASSGSSSSSLMSSGSGSSLNSASLFSSHPALHSSYAGYTQLTYPSFLPAVQTFAGTVNRTLTSPAPSSTSTSSSAQSTSSPSSSSLFQPTLRLSFAPSTSLTCNYIFYFLFFYFNMYVSPFVDILPSPDSLLLLQFFINYIMLDDTFKGWATSPAATIVFECYFLYLYYSLLFAVCRVVPSMQYSQMYKERRDAFYSSDIRDRLRLHPEMYISSYNAKKDLPSFLPALFDTAQACAQFSSYQFNPQTATNTTQPVFDRYSSDDCRQYEDSITTMFDLWITIIEPWALLQRMRLTETEKKPILVSPSMSPFASPTTYFLAPSPSSSAQLEKLGVKMPGSAGMLAASPSASPLESASASSLSPSSSSPQLQSSPSTSTLSNLSNQSIIPGCTPWLAFISHYYFLYRDIFPIFLSISTHMLKSKCYLSAAVLKDAFAIVFSVMHLIRANEGILRRAADMIQTAIRELCIKEEAEVAEAEERKRGWSGRRGGGMGQGFGFGFGGYGGGGGGQLMQQSFYYSQQQPQGMRLGGQSMGHTSSSTAAALAAQINADNILRAVVDTARDGEERTMTLLLMSHLGRLSCYSILLGQKSQEAELLNSMRTALLSSMSTSLLSDSSSLLYSQSLPSSSYPSSLSTSSNSSASSSSSSSSSLRKSNALQSVKLGALPLTVSYQPLLSPQYVQLASDFIHSVHMCGDFSPEVSRSLSQFTCSLFNIADNVKDVRRKDKKKDEPKGEKEDTDDDDDTDDNSNFAEDSRKYPPFQRFVLRVQKFWNAFIEEDEVPASPEETKGPYQRMPFAQPRQMTLYDPPRSDENSTKSFSNSLIRSLAASAPDCNTYSQPARTDIGNQTRLYSESSSPFSLGKDNEKTCLCVSSTKEFAIRYPEHTEKKNLKDLVDARTIPDITITSSLEGHEIKYNLLKEKTIESDTMRMNFATNKMKRSASQREAFQASHNFSHEHNHAGTPNKISNKCHTLVNDKQLLIEKDRLVDMTLLQLLNILGSALTKMKSKKESSGEGNAAIYRKENTMNTVNKEYRQEEIIEFDAEAVQAHSEIPSKTIRIPFEQSTVYDETNAIKQSADDFATTTSPISVQTSTFTSTDSSVIHQLPLKSSSYPQRSCSSFASCSSSDASLSFSESSLLDPLLEHNIVHWNRAGKKLAGLSSDFDFEIDGVKESNSAVGAQMLMTSQWKMQDEMEKRREKEEADTGEEEVEEDVEEGRRGAEGDNYIDKRNDSNIYETEDKTSEKKTRKQRQFERRRRMIRHQIKEAKEFHRIFGIWVRKEKMLDKEEEEVWRRTEEKLKEKLERKNADFFKKENGTKMEEGEEYHVSEAHNFSVEKQKEVEKGTDVHSNIVELNKKGNEAKKSERREELDFFANERFQTIEELKTLLKTISEDQIGEEKMIELLDRLNRKQEKYARKAKEREMTQLELLMQQRNRVKAKKKAQNERKIRKEEEEEEEALQSISDGENKSSSTHFAEPDNFTQLDEKFVIRIDRIHQLSDATRTFPLSTAASSPLLLSSPLESLTKLDRNKDTSESCSLTTATSSHCPSIHSDRCSPQISLLSFSSSPSPLPSPASSKLSRSATHEEHSPALLSSSVSNDLRSQYEANIQFANPLFPTSTSPTAFTNSNFFPTSFVNSIKKFQLMNFPCSKIDFAPLLITHPFSSGTYETQMLSDFESSFSGLFYAGIEQQECESDCHYVWIENGNEKTSGNAKEFCSTASTSSIPHNVSDVIFDPCENVNEFFQNSPDSASFHLPEHRVNRKTKKLRNIFGEQKFLKNPPPFFEVPLDVQLKRRYSITPTITPFSFSCNNIFCSKPFFSSAQRLYRENHCRYFHTNKATWASVQFKMTSAHTKYPWTFDKQLRT